MSHDTPQDSPTPRTDALAKELPPYAGKWVESEEYEQLERELAEVSALLAKNEGRVKKIVDESLLERAKRAEAALANITISANAWAETCRELEDKIDSTPSAEAALAALRSGRDEALEEAAVYVETRELLWSKSRNGAKEVDDIKEYIARGIRGLKRALKIAAPQPAPVDAELKKLMRFYSVENLPDLVTIQNEHIEKLQAKMPALRDTEPLNPRKG